MLWLTCTVPTSSIVSICHDRRAMSVPLEYRTPRLAASIIACGVGSSTLRSKVHYYDILQCHQT